MNVDDPPDEFARERATDLPAAEFERELLRTPFERGGRELGVGIDCAGVARAILARAGVEFPDPWDVLAQQWRKGQLDAESIMPADWYRLPAAAPLRNLDLAFLDAERLSVGVVLGGHLWTATEAGGVVRLPVSRCAVAQAWRRAP